jgi:hypothetical protein
MPDTIQGILEDLTGQEATAPGDYDEEVNRLLASSGIGYSQLNEILLLFGYDRVTLAFFQLLLDAAPRHRGATAIRSLEAFRVAVDCFRLRAILRFGNVKYAFKSMSALNAEGLAAESHIFDPVDESEFARRHDPLIPIISIPGDQTYYLGYLIKRELDARLEENSEDAEAKQQMQVREAVVKKGKANHLAYLASDHMDVYVATSMRERHEYQIVSQVVTEVFESPDLRDLKIRWFDPTQAYCEDRIDKGLVEGLMLKRATCALYLAQESDALGKDSELASTLAQGKPVIAYIPSVPPDGEEAYVDHLLTWIKKGLPNADDRELVLQQLRVFCPAAAWDDKEVMSWVADRPKMDLVKAKQKLGHCIRARYDKRAGTLKQAHPLGIQVHLETGVANGVLVARSPSQCRELIRRVLTNTLEFSLCEKEIDGNRYLFVKEKVSDSIFRVVTGDRFITNVFWNFYLPK